MLKIFQRLGYDTNESENISEDQIIDKSIYNRDNNVREKEKKFNCKAFSPKMSNFRKNSTQAFTSLFRMVESPLTYRDQEINEIFPNIRKIISKDNLIQKKKSDLIKENVFERLNKDKKNTNKFNDNPKE